MPRSSSAPPRSHPRRLRECLTRAALLLAAVPGPSFAESFGDFTAQFGRSDGEPVLNVAGKSDLPEGALITIRVQGFGYDLGGSRMQPNILDSQVTVSAGAFDENIPLPADLRPGRYAVTAELVALTQTDSEVLLRLARRRSPPPVTREAFFGTTDDALRALGADLDLARKRLDGTEELLKSLSEFARNRQRSTATESRMKGSVDALYLDIQEGGLAEIPPFPGTYGGLDAVLYELLGVVPARVIDDEGNPDAEAENDPSIFDGRIEKAVAAQQPALTRLRALLFREHANAILGEIERACRRLAEAYRTSAANPRDWADSVREAREAADKLLAAASAPEAAAALGGKGANHVALLQALTNQLEARPPAPPPAEGEPADPKLPADVAEGLENIARSLQAARSKLAS